MPPTWFHEHPEGFWWLQWANAAEAAENEGQKAHADRQQALKR